MGGKEVSIIKSLNQRLKSHLRPYFAYKKSKSKLLMRYRINEIYDICVTFRPADMQVSSKIATKYPITTDSTNLSLEEKILQELRHNPALTIRDLSDSLSANRGLIYRKIQNLITKNILIREGGNRKGKWVITKELTVTKA